MIMKLFKYIFLMLILVMSFSCKKDLADLNVNPDQPLSTNPDYVFTYVLQQGMGNYNSDVTLEQWSIMNWVMYMATRGGVEPGKEYEVPGGKDAFWREQYTNTLSNAQLIIDMAKDDPEMVNKSAAAGIWQVYIFQIITDLWGDIPYSEALKGMTELEYTPVYDRQSEIYTLLIEKLANAVDSFDESKMFFTSESDIIYHGNMNKWIAFANSLQLRLATRINKVDFETYSNVVSELKNSPLIENQEGTAIFPFNSVAKNHLWETMFRGESTVQNNPSRFFVDLIVDNDDPRAKVFFEKAPLSFLPFIPKYNGVPNLLANNSPEWENYNLNEALGVEGEWGDISKIGEWFLNNNTPGIIMNYSEVCFLKAEAALNGLWDESADNLFAEGVQANMEFYNLYANENNTISTEDINSFIEVLPVANLKEIITQKWISFAYEQGYEAYAEYRRTGFPELTNYDGALIDQGIFPVRVPYPYAEFTLNKTNYDAAISRQGADDEFTRLWWDEE